MTLESRFHRFGSMAYCIQTWTRVDGGAGRLVLDSSYWGHRMMRNWQCCDVCPLPPCEATAAPEVIEDEEP